MLRIIETASSDVKIVHGSGLDKLLIIPAGAFSIKQWIQRRIELIYERQKIERAALTMKHV